MRSFAEVLVEKGLLLATFFFFRSDGKRNNLEHLIPTITYQLCIQVPPLRPWVEDAIELNPLIFTSSLSRQTQTLIINPFLHYFYDPGSVISSPFPRIILIDGLDECTGHDNQQEVLETLSKMIQTLPIPITIVFASRPEPQIRSAVAQGRLREMSAPITLDDSFNPVQDLRYFYITQFDEIRSLHPMRSHLGADWPSEEVIRTLIRNASGQFIYAATVMKFIKSYLHNPADRLQIILQQADLIGIFKPFEELDNLYAAVFFNIDPDILPNMLRVLGVILTPPQNGGMGHQSPRFMDSLLCFPNGRVQSLLLGLESLLTVTGDTNDIHISHTSLSDFLFNRWRSRGCFVDRGLVYADIASSCIKLFCCPRIMDFDFCQPLIESYLEQQLRISLQKATPTDRLRRTINSCEISSLISFQQPNGIGISKLAPLFLLGVKESRYGDAEKLYLTALESMGAVINAKLIEHWSEEGYGRTRPLLLFLLLFALTDADSEQAEGFLTDFSIFTPGVRSPLCILPGVVYQRGDDTRTAEEWHSLCRLILDAIKVPQTGFLSDPRGKQACMDLALHLLQRTSKISSSSPPPPQSGYLESILPFLLDISIVHADLVTAVQRLNRDLYHLDSPLIAAANNYIERAVEDRRDEGNTRSIWATFRSFLF